MPPLLSLILYISMQHTWWALIALIPLSVLWIQGSRREQEFQILMLGAFKRGVVQSQAIDEFNAWIDRIPTEGLEP